MGAGHPPDPQPWAQICAENSFFETSSVLQNTFAGTARRTGDWNSVQNPGACHIKQTVAGF